MNGVTDGDFVFSDESKTDLRAYIGTATEVTIPSSVTSIGHAAFAFCSSLTSVTIPDGVTSIGSDAFRECSSLTSVTIPDGVTSIGSYAFWGCSSLTSVTIPDGVTSIGNYAFYNCSSLTFVTIPDGVNSIGGSAFYRVKHIEYHGTATGAPWGAISMNGVTEGDFVFSDESKTELIAYIGTAAEVTIPSSVTSIGNGTFYNCSSLTSVTIPAGVTSIGDYAFYDCSSLTSVTIPDGCTSIGNYAFSGCRSLTEIYSMSSNPPTLGDEAFTSVHFSIPVYVPCSAVADYQAADGWRSFTNIQEAVENTVTLGDSYHGSVNIVQPTCDDNTATLTATADEDFYFDHWSDGSIENPHTITVTSDTTLSAYFMKLVHDTVRISNNYYQYDTTIVNVYDTVIHYDTTIVNTYQYDTTIVNIFDTVIRNIYQYDTTLVNIYDTTINNYYQYDTTVVNNQYFDTVFVTHYYHDTVVVNNYVYDTIYLNRYIFDTVYLHDTVFVDPTDPLGIHEMETVDAKIYQRDGRIVVESGDGGQLGEVRVFDVMGRSLAQDPLLGCGDGRATFEVPATGTYIVKIGDRTAKKIVIVR